MGLI
ncbi:uncharacterized protein FRV6_16886 [Fusarium oxysporum]|jgi:hypothetical protein